METWNVNRGRWALFIVLPLIVLAGLSLWYLKNVYRMEGLVPVQSEHGVFDLTGIDFTTGFVRLEGPVEYIPGIMTPEEFTARAGEAETGNPWYISSATSRIRILAPDEGVYAVTGSSIDYAHRAYLNGELRFQAGVPSEHEEDFAPGYGWMEVEVRPEKGVIELVQQSGNFVHREGGGHSNLYFGRPEIIKHFGSLTAFTEALNVGLFAALFFVHLLLFVVEPGYRPNLIFSLFCLTWAVRSGLTNAKIFYSIFPALPWQLAFRVEYLSLPIASILMVLLAREIFGGLAQKWFVSAVSVAAAVFSVLCLTLDTVWLSWALLIFEGFFILSILYLCLHFITKAPGMVRCGQFRAQQTVSLIGFSLFMMAAISDALFHAGVYYGLGFTVSFAVTGPALLVFSFFQMTAMFYGAMGEAALAHQRESRAEAEKEMLSEMSRLKSSFYTDMSHEMKTPLTVIAVNAQFAAQNIETGVVDEETVTDLTAISAEARRLAQMVTSLVGIGRMQGNRDGHLTLTPLLTETARIYQSLFARKNNTLTVEADPDLPSVKGSADQIIQVLINLLSNANRHTQGGRVTIRGETFKGQVRVSVTDNGEGIPPDLLPHVFERFFHGEQGGSGLGLPICRTIIREHGGEINIESEEGRGTAVWFTLPVKEEGKDEGEGDNPSGGGR